MWRTCIQITCATKTYQQDNWLYSWMTFYICFVFFANIRFYSNDYCLKISLLIFRQVKNCYCRFPNLHPQYLSRYRNITLYDLIKFVQNQQFFFKHIQNIIWDDKKSVLRIWALNIDNDIFYHRNSWYFFRSEFLSQNS